MLGLAKRAGKAVSGTDAVLEKIRTKSSELVIISNDASDGTKKKLTDKCKHYNLMYVFFGSCDTLAKAIGTDNTVAVAIVDKNFADAILRIYNNLTEVAENGSC